MTRREDPTAPPGPTDRDPLELSSAELRRLGHQLVDAVADYLDGLPARPVFRRMTPDQRSRILERALPEAGLLPVEIVEFLWQAVAPFPMGNGHPRFFGWVNSAPAPLAVLTELVAAAMNPSCAGGDHAGVYLEHLCIRWLKELLGFPQEGGYGLLTSGGSTASLTALAAARHRAAAQGGRDVRERGVGDTELVLYLSEETHSCVRKAAELLGLGRRCVHTVPTDRGFRMDVAALKRAIAADRAAGRQPFCVVASAGTVNTGAIDPLDALADVCAANDLWLHVDGAYGAPGLLYEGAAASYRGLERADSIAMDPHKWLAVPVECGAVLVRSEPLLRDTFSLVPSYLRVPQDRGFGNLPWFSEYGFQQTRGNRALKLFVTLSQLGRAGARQLVTRHCLLAQRLAQRVQAHPALELLADVPLSIVCFRYRPADRRADSDGDEAARDALNALNRELLNVLVEQGRVFLSGTLLRGCFALRACVLHHATTEADIDAVIDAVVDAGRALARA
jgi:glutamate/tyrosine decarboxylase-like PLP-dependent enzyme